MVTQSPPALGVARRVPAEVTADRLPRYRLTVFGACAVDVVGAVGGWMFDRAMAGWQVDALLADAGDTRPLRILGVRPHALDADPAAASGPGAGIAVAGDLLVSDHRVRAHVLDGVRSRRTEVAVWGAAVSNEVIGPVEAVRYSLSAAARVFKRHALAAAGCPEMAVGRTEALCRGDYRPLDSDLVPER